MPTAAPWALLSTRYTAMATDTLRAQLRDTRRALTDTEQRKAAQAVAKILAQQSWLIALCEQLKRDNQQLIERQSALLTERSQLLEQNELARQKIELMINRLRGLNTDQ